jgi:glycine dehydrogenase subunit 1
MRYLPHTAEDRKQMLAKIGVASVDALYNNVPKECNLNPAINLPNTKPEAEVEHIIGHMAHKNHPAQNGPFFLGAGCYYHHIPASVDHIIQRSEFLTSYTPYQPEVSQGTLAVIFQFQSMIAALTGQEIANASMYDGATSVAEAALMAKRINKRPNIKIHGELHPHYKETIETYMQVIGGEISQGEPDSNTACLIVQSPDFHGNIHAYEELRKKCDAAGCLLVVVVTEILSLGTLPAPKIADIVCGEAQSVGVGMQFGGPHLGFFACKKEFVRQMPGRLCGATVDANGKRSFVLTLSTREQHIRREKATSNICTNVGLMATAFTVHMSLLGEEGFKQLARLNHAKACEVADKINALKGYKVVNQTFFNEFVVKTDDLASRVIDELSQIGIIAGLAVGRHELLVAVTETATEEHIESFIKELGK